MTESHIIYMDNAATTPVRQEVVDAMIPYLRENFGNPSSLYDIAKTNREAVALARSRVARALNAEDKEIYFTSCGTESDNVSFPVDRLDEVMLAVVPLPAVIAVIDVPHAE